VSLERCQGALHGPLVVLDKELRGEARPLRHGYGLLEGVRESVRVHVDAIVANEAFRREQLLALKHLQLDRRLVVEVAADGRDEVVDRPAVGKNRVPVGLHRVELDDRRDDEALNLGHRRLAGGIKAAELPVVRAGNEDACGVGIARLAGHLVVIDRAIEEAVVVVVGLRDQDVADLFAGRHSPGERRVRGINRGFERRRHGDTCRESTRRADQERGGAERANQAELLQDGHSSRLMDGRSAIDPGLLAVTPG